MIVRAAVPADLERVLDLIRSIPELPQWPPEAFAVLQHDRDPLNTGREGPIRRMLVAEDGGALLGLIQFTALMDTAEVENIAVAASARRLGVGSRLLRQAIEAARRESVTRMFLEVRAGNEAALRLYRAAGFVVVGQRPNYYARPVEHAMLLELSWAGTV